MKARTRRRTRDDAGQDRGVSLVEVLVASVLLGTAGIAVLGSLAASIRGSRINKNHAASVVWLQSAADYVVNLPYVDCTVGTEAAVATSYQQSLQSVAAPTSPLGWAQAQLKVDGQVKFWNGSSFVSTCTPNTLEQVVLRVTVPGSSDSWATTITKSAYQG